MLGLCLSGCSGSVEVPDVQLAGQELAACTAFLDAVPEPLVDLGRVDVAGSERAARAFGDPAVVVTCLDRVPADYDELAFCLEVNGIGWYLPEDQLEDEGADATFTAVGFRPVVQVRAPGEYRPETAAAILSELSAPVEQNLTETAPCS